MSTKREHFVIGMRKDEQPASRRQRAGIFGQVAYEPVEPELLGACCYGGSHLAFDAEAKRREACAKAVPLSFAGCLRTGLKSGRGRADKPDSACAVMRRGREEIE